MRSAHYNAPSPLNYWFLAQYNALRYDQSTLLKRSLKGLARHLPPVSPNLKISLIPEKACVIGYPDLRLFSKCALTLVWTHLNLIHLIGSRDMCRCALVSIGRGG